MLRILSGFIQRFWGLTLPEGACFFLRKTGMTFMTSLERDPQFSKDQLTKNLSLLYTVLGMPSLHGRWAGTHGT